MTSSKELIALQFPFFEDRYEENLEKLTTLIKQAPDDSVVVAPELCLTNFSFDKLDQAAAFGTASLPHLLALSEKKIIAFTMTEKIDGKFYNSAKVLHRGKVIHSQPKVKLFTFGNEDKFFSPGSPEKVKIVEIGNIRYCILICFEIRFIKLWLQIQGADIILIPALWGKLRKEQLEAISQSMAILNEAFVVLANSANDDMAKSSGIITPFGIEFRDDRSQYLSHTADLKEIQKMRRYMDIGIR
jgi:predicted amidohydrolase